jgi:hypothetical protein
MLNRVCLTLTLAATASAWSQVAPSATGSPDDEIRMRTPPPVSGEAYPNLVGAESRSNYLRGGVLFDTAYNDNVRIGSAVPVGDTILTVWPAISLQQTTSRQERKFSYSPGFTFYEPTSTLNNIDQNATLDYQYRLTKYATVSVDDFFQKTSNVFNQPYPLTGGGVSGSPEPQPASVVAPFADQITNLTDADLSYQFSRNEMVGGGGTFTELHFPDLSQVPGLYDSSARGGSGFYSHRFMGVQYVGGNYQYLESQANPTNVQSETQTHTFYGFYTIYLERSLSLSLSGGPQHYDATHTSSKPYQGWTPAAMASLGWQTGHTNLAMNYSRGVIGGGGLLGAFVGNSANANARWQIAKTWSVGAAANYAINKNITPLFPLSPAGGHGIAATASIEHAIGERLSAEFGYSRLHQSYSGIKAISNNPDSNRAFVTISYQFIRPIGR